ncbi:MAG: ABC transporter substrate-binding protein [Actinomycetota bacterium]|nr:ABC transporter substrate-binding protein [Actinomycetota bacterium]
MTTRLLVVAAVTSLLVGACNGSSSSTIHIGTMYPMTGTQGPGGIEEYRGVRLAADFVNNDGGIDGKRIAITPMDVPDSDAVPGVVDRLASNGIDLVMGSYGSTISAPTASLTSQRGMLFWETGSVGEQDMSEDEEEKASMGEVKEASSETGRLSFRVPPTGVVLGRGAIDFMAHKYAALIHRDPKNFRFAIANVNDVYGSTVARGAVEELHDLGLHLAGRFPYNAASFSARHLVQRIAKVHPDVLFVSAYLDDGVAISRETIAQHLDLAGSIGTSSSYCMPQFGAALGKQAVGLFASDKPDAGSINRRGLSPEARELLDRAATAYRSRYGQAMSAPALAGFTAAWALFTDVMPNADSLTPDGIARAARATKLPIGSLPNGSGLEFRSHTDPGFNDNLRAESVIWEWVGVEKRAIVWPPRYATEPIRTLVASR